LNTPKSPEDDHHEEGRNHPRLAWQLACGSPDRKVGLAISVNGGSPVHIHDGENIAVPEGTAEASVSLEI